MPRNKDLLEPSHFVLHGDELQLELHDLLSAFGLLQPDRSRDALLGAYDRLLARTRTELASLMGERGADAVLRRGISLARQEKPLLELVELPFLRISLAPLNDPELSCPPGELRDALRGLVRAVWTVTVSLIGRDLVRALISSIARHEREEH